MMTVAGLENDMAKRKSKKDGPPRVQKTFFLPDGVCKLAEAYERVAGINFTRQVVASLLHYYLETPSGPPLDLIQYVIGIEQGSIEVFDVPISILESRRTSINFEIDRMSTGACKESFKQDVVRLQHIRSGIEGLIRHFKQLKGADDPPADYAATWMKHAQPSTVSMAMLGGLRGRGDDPVAEEVLARVDRDLQEEKHARDRKKK